MTDFATKSENLRAMRAAGRASISYEIVIDEPQRAALLNLIADNAGRPGFEALEYWTEMLEELPAQEAETPGMMHGFCL